MTETLVRNILAALQGKTFDQLYFVACGGSSALMYPSKFFADRHSRKMNCDYYNADEFIHLAPAALGERSLVITCSQEGKTPETVAAARFAKNRGATVIALAMKPGTPLEQVADHFVLYGHYLTSPAIETSYGAVYMLTAGILEQNEGIPLFEGMVKALGAAAPVIKAAIEQFRPQADEFANACKDARVLYSLASGPDFSQSYVFCNCYMMEMQWINAIPIHAGEFFHGPFEIIEKDSPVVLLLGRSSCRSLEERALAFCQQYTQNLFIIDTKEVDFQNIDEAYHDVVAVLVLNNACRLFSQTIAVLREHSLDIRRYMHLVEY
ncbi:MAG: SIS domain-containing protein [Lentisphaerota bacterium]